MNRARMIVEQAAAMVQLEGTRQLLQRDERGMFEKLVLEMLASGTVQEAAKTMTEEKVNEAVAVEVALQATTALMRRAEGMFGGQG